VEYPPAVIAAFRDLARKHGLALVIDETYRDFHSQDGSPHELLADPDWDDTVIRLYSFSKAYRLTGHRVGALMSSPERLAEVEKFIDQIPGTNTTGDVSSSRELGYAPELTWQARVQYAIPLANGGTLTLGADADYRDEMFTDSPIDTTNPFFLNAQSEDRTMVNAFLTYRSPDQRWRLAVEGKNLTDERVLENTFNVSNFILGGYSRGRTYGITVGYTFE
jgi:outer membrane receptor protein involved in Fe transport